MDKNSRVMPVVCGIVAAVIAAAIFLIRNNHAASMGGEEISQAGLW